MSGSPEISSQPVSPEISKPAFTMPEVKTVSPQALDGANFLSRQISTKRPSKTIMKNFLTLPDKTKPPASIDSLPNNQRLDRRTYLKQQLSQFKKDNPKATYQEQVTFAAAQTEQWDKSHSNQPENSTTDRIEENKRIEQKDYLIDTKKPIEKAPVKPESPRREATAQQNKEQILTDKIAQIKSRMNEIISLMEQAQTGETTAEKFMQQILLLIMQIIMLTGDISVGISAVQSESKPKNTVTTSEKPQTYKVVEKSPPRQLPDLQAKNQPKELSYTPIKGLLPDLQATQGIPIEMPTKTPEMVMASGRK